MRGGQALHVAGDRADGPDLRGLVYTWDLEGKPRIYRNKTVDLGCYEYKSVGMSLIVR